MSLDLDLVAIVDADFDLEAPILGQFGRTGTADGCHLVAALTIEEDGADAGLALYASLKGAEHHLAAPPSWRHRQQFGQPDQVVGCCGEGESPADPDGAQKRLLR